MKNFLKSTTFLTNMQTKKNEVTKNVSFQSIFDVQENVGKL